MGWIGRLGAVLSGLLCSLPGAAAPLEGNVHAPRPGVVKGAEPVRLSVSNGTAGAIACIAALAHWHSGDLGRAEPGASLDVTLWHDPGTGATSLANATGDWRPIEAIWCGAAGDLTSTRMRIALPHAAGAAPERLARTCTAGPGGRFACAEAAE